LGREASRNAAWRRPRFDLEGQFSGSISVLHLGSMDLKINASLSMARIEVGGHRSLRTPFPLMRSVLTLSPLLCVCEAAPVVVIIIGLCTCKMMRGVSVRIESTGFVSGNGETVREHEYIPSLTRNSASREPRTWSNVLKSPYGGYFPSRQAVDRESGRQ